MVHRSRGVIHMGANGENAHGVGRIGAEIPVELLAPRDGTALSPDQRDRAMATLRATTADEPLDVLVVGGGVVGCGAALDAAR